MGLRDVLLRRKKGKLAEEGLAMRGSESTSTPNRSYEKAGKQAHAQRLTPLDLSDDHIGKWTTAVNFFPNANHATFQGPVTFTSGMDRSTTTHNIDQGKPVLEILSREMTPGADVDSSARYPPPRCYPGTRETLTAKIQTWIEDDQRNWNILWLHGPAGVGKSAVAQTIAEFAAEKSLLGAAFFFSRTNRRRDPQPVFITLAYQLAVRFPGYLPLVAKQLSTDPDLLKKAPHVQFKKLIVEPLSLLSSRPKHLIILDGLDECKGDRAQLHIVELINNTILSHTSLPIIWMICSRPEPHLMRTLSRADFAIQCWREELPVDTQSSRDDNARFIRARLREIHEEYRDCVEEDADGCWPSQDATDCIINEASGLFVFSSTILKHIEDNESGNPEQRLAEVLALIQDSRVTDGNSPLESLYILYARILSEVPDDIWPTTYQLLAVAVLLGSTVVLTPQLLCNLLGIARSAFYAAVYKLHSILDIPSPNEADTRPTRFFHSSFGDYMTDPSRTGRIRLLSPGIAPYGGIHQSCLRLISSPMSYLAGADDPSELCLRPIANIGRTKAAKLLNQVFSWPLADPESAYAHAFELLHLSKVLVFSLDSQFKAYTDDQDELIGMLFTFDFNTLTFLNVSLGTIRRFLPAFIWWTKGIEPLRDLVRTHSSGSGMDEQLLCHLQQPGVDVEPLDFDLITTRRSFDDLPKRAYFLMGHGTNTILVLVDKQGEHDLAYHSLKSAVEIWPSLAELIGDEPDS